ncbi:PAS domain S-box protein [Bdellovibrio bacteriovorus]|uniref:PAS domain S-box protein n=1 Tax=Bdellovibrio bacteriovorus TaxID=959 RepID=UPI0035A5F03B
MTPTKNEDNGTREVAVALKECKEQILSTWEARCRKKVPAANNLATSALRNSLPKFLDELIHSLEYPQPQKHFLDDERRMATEHGQERSEHPGYNLSQVIDEYYILRQVLFEALESKLKLSSEARDIILDAISVGVRNAAIEFASRKHQEYQSTNESLRTSEEQFRLVVEGVKDHAIICTNQKGDVIYWSPGAENLLGWKSEEMLGRSGSRIFIPEDREKGVDIEEMRTAIAQGMAEDNRWHIRKDNSRFFATGVMNPLRNSHGQLVGFVKVLRDFTEKMITQENLKKETSESQAALKTLNELVMQAPVAMVLVMEPEYRFVIANPAYEKIVGRKVAGKTVFESFTAEEVGHFVPIVNNVIKTGTPFVGKEIRVSLPDEKGIPQNFYVNLSYHPFVESDGVIRGVFTVVQDVTEQVESRKELELANQKLQAILDRAPMGISFIEAPAGKMILMNNQARTILGHESRVQDGYHQYGRMGAIHKDGSPYSAEEYPTVRAFKNGETIIDEDMTYVRPDGKKIDLSVSAGPIINHDGEISGAVGTFFDVTERNRLRAELEEREENFRAIFTQAASGIARMSTSSRWELVNERLLDILQYSLSELTQKTCIEMTHPDDAGIELHHLEELKAGKYDSFSMELRYLRKDGNYVWVHLTKSIVRDSQGAAKYYISVIEDITQRKKLEEELHRAKLAADRASASKSAFLANMSHEIRTPMTAVLGFTEILKDSTLTQSERMDAIARIDNSGRALLRLIDDILDISKIEAGRLDIQKSRFSPVAIVSEIVSFMRVNAERKGVSLKLKLDASVPSEATSDPGRLRQILVNLIGNAIKFTSEGEVVVSVKAEASRYLIFSVCDTGIGISEQDLKNLFKPFAQADGSITRKFGGTGLGLVLSRRLAETLGGSLEVSESVVGKGTTFVVRIDAKPFSYTDQPTIYVANEAKDAGSNQLELVNVRVLLAEDVVDNQVLLSKYLEKAGAQIAFANNGAEALEQALQGDFDIVLMDIQMPVLDGIRATKELRSRGYTRPIVALTAHAMPEEVKKSIEAGCNAHLTKPIDKKGLIEAIQKFIK